jgi:hypothetical protein
MNCASGKPLDIYVSYHDVSNEFAPAIKAGVAKGAADDKVNAGDLWGAAGESGRAGRALLSFRVGSR